MRFRNKIIYFFGIFLWLTMLCGCTNEESESLSGGTTGKAEVNLMIADNMSLQSRDVAVSEDEKTLSNLYIIAVRLTDIDSNGKEITLDTPTIEQFSIDPNATSNKVYHEGYKSYTIDLFPGKYRFYVLGNTSLYIPNYANATITDESQMKRIILNYNLTQTTNQILQPGHLPMFCDAKNIKYGNHNYPTPVNPSNQNKNNYTVDVTSVATTNIYADMELLCAKVRYTIIYDNTKGGVSEAFGTESIRFVVDQDHPAYAHKIRKQTKLYSDGVPSPDDYDSENPFLTAVNGEEENDAVWQLPLGRYELTDALKSALYATNYSEESMRQALDHLTPWSQDDVNNTNWKNSRQRVWQGVIYLPENNENGIPYTELCFPYILGWYKRDGSLGEGEGENAVIGLKTFEMFNEISHNHGLQRGYFYDVIARVKTPDDIDFDITLNVYVKSWDYYHEEGNW